PVAEMVHRFNTGLLIVAGLILLLVLVLLAYCIVRFNARANPVPSRTSHNTLIEVLWTLVPILILIGIAVPSFALLFAQHNPERAIAGYDAVKDKPRNIRPSGSRWCWSYECADLDGLSCDSYMLQADQMTDPANEPGLLAVDNEMVVPV